MAYADQRRSGRRLGAIIIVILLHIVLAYALISGLAVRTVKAVQSDLNVFDVEEEEPPPPEEEPPPPPPDTPIPPPPVAVTQVPVPIVRAVPRPLPLPRVIPVPRAAPAPPPAPPAPPPPSQAARATPTGRPQNWVTNADYPSASLRNEESGTTGVRLAIGTDGRVTECTVTSSSGFPRLDTAACNLLRRRARFEPAQDNAGNPIAGTWSSTFRWEVPE